MCIGGGRRSCGNWLNGPLTLSDRCDGAAKNVHCLDGGPLCSSILGYRITGAKSILQRISVPFLKKKERLQVKDKDRRDGFVLLSRQVQHLFYDYLVVVSNGSKQVGVGLYHPSS